MIINFHEINMESKFVRFVNNKDFLIDDILNGFKLREHNIEYRPSVFNLMPDLVEFWKLTGNKSKYIEEIVQEFESQNTDGFWLWYCNKIKSDLHFDVHISTYFNIIKSAQINMKCFTELRDNQKIHKSHTEKYGNYGIVFNKEWMIRNKADRVIYVNVNSEITNRIGRLIAMLTTSFHSKSSILSIFDILALTEKEENYHEYEWRIVGNHNYAGKSYGNYPDVILFSTHEIECIYVENDSDINQFEIIINEKNLKEGTTNIPLIKNIKKIIIPE